MPRAARLAGGAALGLLLAAQAAAALEPISVAIAIGAASALTGYLSKDVYCRFAECCPKEQPLNASGTAAGRPGGARGSGARPAALTGGGGGRQDGRDLGPDSRPGSPTLRDDSPDREAPPTLLSKCSDSLGLQ